MHEIIITLQLVYRKYKMGKEKEKKKKNMDSLQHSQQYVEPNKPNLRYLKPNLRSLKPKSQLQTWVQPNTTHQLELIDSVRLHL